jgi:hypothetical protein
MLHMELFSQELSQILFLGMRQHISMIPDHMRWITSLSDLFLNMLFNAELHDPQAVSFTEKSYNICGKSNMKTLHHHGPVISLYWGCIHMQS